MDGDDPTTGSRCVPVTRRPAVTPGGAVDSVVVEEPIEMRYAGAPVGTVMRTPGADVDLVLGHLFAEGWISGLADVGSLAICGREVGLRNVADLIPAPGATPPLGSRRENVATSSCGVCGKASIDEALRLHPPPAGGTDEASWALPAALVASLPDRMRAEQRLFASTGALHAAAVVDIDGALLVVREDIGRHNAVDKAVGWALARGDLPLSRHVLHVSGRVSFEIVQKAYRAGIRLVTAVSGVSSLAIEFAEATGTTLVGFLRDGRFTVYSGDRVAG